MILWTTACTNSSVDYNARWPCGRQTAVQMRALRLAGSCGLISAYSAINIETLKLQILENASTENT